MRRMVVTCMILFLTWPAAWGGVVIQMEVVDPDSPGKTMTDTIYAEGEKLRIDPHSTQGNEEISLLFRDDAMWMVDHRKKVCQKIDRESMEQMSAQLGGAMKEMEAQLAKLPPDQRAMVEKMMKGRMPTGAGMGEAPPRRIEAGATEQVLEYSCTVHTLYSGDEKMWEVCAADESAVGAAAEAVEAFRTMSEFVEQLREVMQQGPFSEMMDTPFNDMNEIGGFPVRVRTFKQGQLELETTLESVERQDLADDVFAIPKSYKVKNLAPSDPSGRH